MREVKVRLISKHSMNNRKNDAAHGRFTIKWNDTEIDKDGCEIDIEQENH